MNLPSEIIPNTLKKDAQTGRASQGDFSRVIKNNLFGFHVLIHLIVCVCVLMLVFLVCVSRRYEGADSPNSVFCVSRRFLGVCT